MSFWDKSNQQPTQSQEQSESVTYDEQVVTTILGNPELDLNPNGDEEFEDTADLMVNANLRLEQGRLYQMILSNDIFGETDADPKAIRNVQREIRRFVRDRMEIMLGIKQEQVAQTPIISSPFNDLEVTALKMLASKVTGGRTEEVQSAPQTPSSKKDGITAISGNLRPQATTPIKSLSKPIPKPTEKPKNKPAPVKSAIQTEESSLKKPIDEMTEQEKVEYDKQAQERSARKRAAPQSGLIPHPSPQQLEMMYAGMVSQPSVSLSNARFRPYE